MSALHQRQGKARAGEVWPATKDDSAPGLCSFPHSSPRDCEVSCTTAAGVAQPVKASHAWARGRAAGEAEEGAYNGLNGETDWGTELKIRCAAYGREWTRRRWVGVRVGGEIHRAKAGQPRRCARDAREGTVRGGLGGSELPYASFAPFRGQKGGGEGDSLPGAQPGKHDCLRHLATALILSLRRNAGGAELPGGGGLGATATDKPRRAHGLPRYPDYGTLIVKTVTLFVSSPSWIVLAGSAVTRMVYVPGATLSQLRVACTTPVAATVPALTFAPMFR